MKIAICGISGFIGSTVSRFFQESGHKVVGIGRYDLAKGIGYIQQVLLGTDVLINLAGAPILKRWTTRWKQEIYSSRVETTRLLVEAMNGMSQPPATFISTSAVGIYDDENIHDEFSVNFSDSFLGKVCVDWESETFKINPSVRLCVFRLGVVLSKSGGALKKMIIPFKMGIGGRIGNGYQFFPYIHILDLYHALKWAIETPSALGVFNLVSPQITTNNEFTDNLATVLNRRTFIPVPQAILHLFFGEAKQTLLCGQHVIPQRLLEAGFKFQFPTLINALEFEFTRKNKRND